ncbi:MAG: hypothetical protein JOZ69_08655 [Myxococcales bacterium]|nr:hypothetical protein [Myxococcales bacterium]
MKMKTVGLLRSVATSFGAFAVACGSFSQGSSANGLGGSGNNTASSSSGAASGSSSGGGSSASGAASSSSGSGAASSSSGAGGPPPTGGTVCEILANGGNPCVAAHSMTRVLYTGYTGPLYQVCKGTAAPGPASCAAGTTMDIGAVGGVADTASQDAFCAGGTCTISVIYDQSPNANHLNPAPAGGMKTSPDKPANATDLKTTLNGHTVYGLFIKPGMGYRAGCSGCGTPVAKGTATGDQPETIYMVTTQNGLIDGCCFDYGNAEVDSHDDGNGTMEAVYFGGGVIWGTGTPGGHTNGPWVMADLENGIYAGWENNQDQAISSNPRLAMPFVTGVVVGDTAAQNGGKGRFALYGGDATAGTLKTLWDGIRPAKPGYVPMQKQGSIILGTGGDNSDGDGGQWFEGVMASGAATLPTVNALQANIVAAGYGH